MRKLVLGALWLALITGLGMAETAKERMPAVAGQFYPADSSKLAAGMDAHLAAGRAPLGAAPVAIVCPHADYAYCGAIMAEAWRQVRSHPYDLIVLLGTNHSDPAFEGVSVWREGAWRTPLGLAPVDEALAAALLEADPAHCRDRPQTHLAEHSIEVLVPWAQRVLPGVPILPLVVSSTDPALCEGFGRTLATAVAGRRVLLVASSDLSHYPSRADARILDRSTLTAMASLQAATFLRTIAEQKRQKVRGYSTSACGEAPILAMMAAARELGATAGRVIAYANSGEVRGGDPGRVVGYGAVAFTAESGAAAP
jgi:AmmeMemoRadiSam system protein B